MQVGGIRHLGRRRLAAQGLDFIEAPLSGSSGQIAQGTATMLLGASAPALQRQAALLQACRLAVDRDGAQAIVIGGGPLAHAAQAIGAALQLRVVDPVRAAVRLACTRAGLAA